jgi:hypothetical protein
MAPFPVPFARPLTPIPRCRVGLMFPGDIACVPAPCCLAWGGVLVVDLVPAKTCEDHAVPSNVLPVRIEVPSASAALIARFTVSAGFTKDGNQTSLGAESYDAAGGVFAREISSDDMQFILAVRLRVTVEFAAQTNLPPWTVEKIYSKDDVQQSLPLGINFALGLLNRTPHAFQVALNCALAFLDSDHLTVQWSYRKGADTFASQSVIIPGHALPKSDQLGRPVNVLSAQFFRTPEFSPAEKLVLQLSGRFRNVDLAAFTQDLDLRMLYAFNVISNFPNPGQLELNPLP